MQKIDGKNEIIYKIPFDEISEKFGLPDVKEKKGIFGRNHWDVEKVEGLINGKAVLVISIKKENIKDDY